MTINEVKDILKSIRTLTYYHKCVLEELKDIAEAEQLAVTAYDKVRVAGGEISDKVPRIADKMRKAYEEHARAWEERQAEYDKIGDAIEELPTELQRIIKDRYLCGKTMQYIANRLYCDKSTIKRKEDEAIRLIAIYTSCNKCNKNS